MPTSKCDTSGETYNWSWTEAFQKFGFNDGAFGFETYQVESVLIEAAYEVTALQHPVHNTLITSIKKNGIEQIPYDKPEYTFSYDNPRDYFPADIIHLLDEKLPEASA